MTAGTFERQHERPRLQSTRLRDAKPRPSSAASEPTAAPQRPHRAAKRSLLASMRAAIVVAMGSQGSGAGASPEGAQAALAKQALQQFRAAKSELRTDSPIALSHLLAWATQSTVAVQLTLAAAAAGLATDQGQRLLEQAARCQGRAERSSTAAIVTAGLLGKPRKGATDGDALAALVANASKPRGAP